MKTRWISSMPPVVGAGQERIDQRVGDLPGVLILRLLGEAGPALPHLAVAEAVVGDALAPDDVGHRLHAFFAQPDRELLGRPECGAAVGTGQSAVAGDHEHCHPAGILPLGRQDVLGRRAARDDRDRLGDRFGVGRRLRHPGLRLGDARGGDELHRLGDLLRRLHCTDPPAVYPQLCTHLLPPSARHVVRVTSLAWACGPSPTPATRLPCRAASASASLTSDRLSCGS